MKARKRSATTATPKPTAKRGFIAKLFGLGQELPGPSNPPSLYPPSPNAYEGVRPEDLLSAHPDKLGGLHADFAQFYPEWEHLRPGIDRLLLNVAAHVQQLPASRAHHHSEQGGLFAHILEVALIALHRRHEYNPRFGLYGGDAFVAEVAWPLSVLIGALLHDIAKPAFLMKVYAEPRASGLDHRRSWNPYTESLYAYMTKNEAQHVFVEWLENRGNMEHDFFAGLWMLRIVPRELIDILYRADIRFLYWLECFLTDRPDPLGKKNILAEVVKWADQRSAREDVESQNISYRWGLSESVAHIFRTFASTQRWNAENAMFWLGALEGSPDERAPMWIITKENIAAFREYAKPYFPPQVGLTYDAAAITQHLVAGGIGVDLSDYPSDTGADTSDPGSRSRNMPTISCRVRHEKLDHHFQHVLFLVPQYVFAKVPNGPVPRLELFAPNGAPSRKKPITIASAKLHRSDPASDPRDIIAPAERPSPVTAASASTPPPAPAAPSADVEAEPRVAHPILGTPSLEAKDDQADADEPQEFDGASIHAADTGVYPDEDDDAESNDGGATNVDPADDDGDGSLDDPFAPIGVPKDSAAHTVPGASPSKRKKGGGGQGASSTHAAVSARLAPSIPQWQFLANWSDEHDRDALTHLVVAFLLERAYRAAGGKVPEKLWGGAWRSLCLKYEDFPRQRRIPLDVIEEGHTEFLSIMRQVEPIYHGFVEDCWPSADPRTLIASQASSAGAFVLGPDGISAGASVSVKLSETGLSELRKFMRQLHPEHRNHDQRSSLDADET